MKKWLTPKEAAKTANRSAMTIINWLKNPRYDIGIKVGGRWQIDREKFNRMLAEGNLDETENE